MKEYLLVGIGGMFGCLARYLSGSYFLHTFSNSKYPWGTFFVNLLGCFLIGVLAACSERLTQFNAEIRLAGITGFLGGFTTFSAFGIETLYLLRDGNLSLALLYSLSSVFIGVLCAYLGMRCSVGA